MSDGQPWDDPTIEVDWLKTGSYFNKIKFYACGFGNECDFSQLKKLTDMFPGGEMTKAPTVNELK